MSSTMSVPTALAALLALVPVASVACADDDPNDGFGFTVQGRLVLDGAPLDLPAGTEVTFTLWETAGGIADRIGDPCTQMVPVNGGLFTALVDVGARADGLAQWLQIEVDPDGEAGPLGGRILLPRRRLHDVPTAEFALQAAPGPRIDDFGDSLFDRRVGVGVPFMDPDLSVVMHLGGFLKVDGDIRIPDSRTLRSSGRLFLQSSGNQPITMNPFSGGNGVIIGGSTAGAPALSVDGNTQVDGDLTFSGSQALRATNRLHLQAQANEPLVLNGIGGENGGEVWIGSPGVTPDLRTYGGAAIDGDLAVGGEIVPKAGGTDVRIDAGENGAVFINPFGGTKYTVIGPGANAKLGVGIFPDFPIRVAATDGSAGAYCTGDTWVNRSDRDSKHAFQPIDAERLLAALRTLPVEEWSYRGDPTGARHIGPTSQDFMAAFSVGADPRGIAGVDSAGVAIAASKALLERCERQADRIAELENKLAARDRQLTDVFDRLTRLEQLLPILPETDR